MNTSLHWSHPHARRGRSRALLAAGAVALLLGGLETAVATPPEALGALPPAGTSAAAGLEIRVATEVPWIGEPVRIEGSGSSAGHRVSVEILRTDVSVSTTASADGTFAVDLPTAGLQPGGYSIYVFDETSRETAESWFRLTGGEPAAPHRTVTVVPGNPVAGGPLAVEGTGYEPGQALRVEVLGTEIRVDTSAGPDGAFSVMLPTTDLLPGAWPVALIADATGWELARTSVTVQPSDGPVDPSVTVRPSSPRAGDPITVTGTDFQPGREVKLELWTLYDYVSVTVLVDADGTLSAKLPTHGTYTEVDYVITVTDTVSRKEFLVPFRTAADLTVHVRTTELLVGDPIIVQGTAGPRGVKITVPGTAISFVPEVDEDGTYWAEVPTTGLAPGVYTVVAVSGSGHYAETAFTLAAAEDGGPGAVPGAPARPTPDPSPEVAEPKPENIDPAVPAPQATETAVAAPGSPSEPQPRDTPELVAVDGTPLRPVRPGLSAPASENDSPPASHSGALAAAVASASTGALPRTGAGIVLAAGTALSLLLAGTGALALARHRSTDH